MGGVITEEPFLNTFPQMRDANVLGIVIASFELGALFGALSCLDLGDRLGRRMTVILGMVFMIVGGVLQASSFSVAQLTVGRIISGYGLGLQVRAPFGFVLRVAVVSSHIEFQVATIPSWQAECAKGKSRGRWVMIEGGLQTLGVASGQWIGYAFFFSKSDAQFRGPIAIQVQCRENAARRVLYLHWPICSSFLP
jgi:MFS family permease